MNAKKPIPGESRRRFLARTAAATAAAGTLSFLPNARGDDERTAARISIIAAPDDPLASQGPVQWAIDHLRACAVSRGYAVSLGARPADAAPGSECLLVASPKSQPAAALLQARRIPPPAAAEAFVLARGRAVERDLLLASASDPRGLVYALLEIADHLNFAAEPLALWRGETNIQEQPANQVRSIARCFVSDVEDKAWFNDRDFWSAYLTELATHRFNRFSLTFGIGYDFTNGIRDCYFHFAYPFLLAVPGYDVRAVPLADQERDQNLAMLKFISEETAKRGLHFQLGLWTHAYRWTSSPNANYVIEGLKADRHAEYCRDALRLILEKCPAISGVTFRIHGESGVPEASYEFWRTVYEGIVKCGRRVEIDMHAKGMDQQMVDVALGTGMPVNISPKFWAEHLGLGYMQGAIRPLEMPPRESRDTGFFAKSSGSRRFLRYGYGDLLREDRKYGVLHRIWPGTQRLLLWGDDALARDYGRAASFCDSAGVELCEPLSFKGRKGSGLPGGRDGYADASLRPRFDFEKYRYTYRIWGRAVYNPASHEDPRGLRFLRHSVGLAGDSLAEALKAAGLILPLITTAHCPSAANNNYWPEMYTNMPIVDPRRPHPYGDTLSPKNFGAVSPLDPEFFSRIDEFVDELLTNQVTGRYSPVDVAAWLDDAADRADAHLRAARAANAGVKSVGSEFHRCAADLDIQIGIGRFFAGKLRAGTSFRIYERTGEPMALEDALAHYRAAREAWAGFSERARAIYRGDLTFGYDRHLRGHWTDRLAGIDADLSDMESLRAAAGQAVKRAYGPAKIAEARAAVRIRAAPAPAAVPEKFHAPIQTFKAGQPVKVTVALDNAIARADFRLIRLRYRHVNQGEAWQSTAMEQSGGSLSAIIPAAYTSSPFPLQYHFEIHRKMGKPALYPGLFSGTSSPQPYFVIRQA